jgi:ornithine cyclodeaminase
MSKTEILYLSEPDLIKTGVLDAGKCINVCEDVFRLIHEGDYLMGGQNHNEHGLVLVFPKETKFKNMPVAGPERRFIAMPAYLGGKFAACGEKWYGSNVKNPKERGLPRSVLTLTINDPDTCEPKAMMSANLISAMRTGCIPGVGVRYMANKSAEVISVVGVGPIQKATLLAMKSEMKNLKKVVAKARHLERAQGFVDWAREELGLEGEAVESLEEATRKGDIVSIAASPEKPLFFKDEWLKEGATVLLTSPITADDDFWLKNKIVFDNAKMHEAYYAEALELGDVKKACNGWGKMYELMENKKMVNLQESISLGDVVLEPTLGRTNEKDKEIFVTSGQVLFDIGWGCELYELAKEKGIGQTLTLWDEPYWS